MSPVFRPCYAAFTVTRPTTTGDSGPHATAGYAHPVSTTASPSGKSNSETRPATIGERFLALLIDWILCLLLAVAVMPRPYGNLWASAFLVVEYAFFVGLFTQTPGMRVAKIRCVRTDGERLGLYRALIRGALLALVVPALIMDSDRRGLHDRAADSVMIR